MRGLKQAFESGKDLNTVASFTDAWIETGAGSNNKYLAGSHLLQMRGLKRDVRRWYYRRESVASFTDAWIETRQQNRRPHLQKVASFTDAWIETYQSAGVFSQCQSHLLQMRGLKRPF